MCLKVKPIGDVHEWDDTDLSVIYYGADEEDLHIILKGWRKGSDKAYKYIEFKFPGDSRFRVLEEMDLEPYWLTGLFKKNYSIYEVLSGGWLEGKEDEKNFLAVFKDFGAREWIIVTDNFCVSVVSRSGPLVSNINEVDA